MPQILDLKDRRILYELELNGRISETEIGKKVGLSKEVIHYRLNKLQKQGIIKSFNTIIDAWNLGFLMHRTYFKFTNLTKEKEEEVINYIKDNVNWIILAQGKWDISTMRFTQHIHEYNIFIKELKLRYGDYIKTYSMSFVEKLWHYKRGYLLNKPIQDLKYIVKEKTVSTPLNINEIDIKILNIISTNARMQYTQIGTIIGINEKVVRDHIKKLTEQKIILGYTTLLDTAKLGYLYYKVHFELKNYSNDSLKKLHTYALFHPNIVYAVDTIEDEHFEIEIQTKSSEEFYKIINDIRTKFPDLISDYFFLEYTAELKYHYLPEKLTRNVSKIERVTKIESRKFITTNHQNITSVKNIHNKT